MDKETLNRRISAGNFVENNGSVLRAVNILKTKFNRLKDIRPVLKLLKKKQRSDRIVAGDEKWIIKKG